MGLGGGSDHVTQENWSLQFIKLFQATDWEKGADVNHARTTFL